MANLDEDATRQRLEAERERVHGLIESLREEGLGESEADQAGGTAGLCTPVERDIFDCHISCFWPAQVPDMLNHSPGWTGKCSAAQKDWRKIDLVFP